MKITDLTHTIHAAMPVYPGTAPPQITLACTVADDGFAERLLCLYSHTGTHIDAPAHLIENAATLDDFPAAQFIGSGVVLDLTEISKSMNQQITLADLLPHAQRIRDRDFVLLYTGWSNLWGEAEYFENYPVLSPDAAEWLARFNLKGIGIDAISVDEVGTALLPIHHIFLRRNIVIIENLTNLQALIGIDFTFSCLPLKIERGDGAPVRAVSFR